MKLHQLHAIHEINIVQGCKGEDTAVLTLRGEEGLFGTFVGKGNVFKSMVLFLVLILKKKKGSFTLLHPNLDE